MTTSSSLYIGNSLAIVPALPAASITAVVTSPPYNLASSTLYSPTFADSLPVKVYIANHVALFRAYDRIVKSDGIVLLNVSYGGDQPSLPMHLVVAIEEQTGWRLGDKIVWKKRFSVAMSASRTQLARHTEDILVFHRNTERERFLCNKPMNVDTGHYGRVSNYVTAANNDGPSPSPCKARFSSDMVAQVLEKYIEPATPGVVILDPFVGSGTMFRACSQLGFACVGIELAREHLDPACIVGVREVKPPVDGKKRKHTETLPAGVCLLHHTEKACTQAMADPARAFLYSVLRKRVKQKKKALSGRLFKSEVAGMLNKPMTKAEKKLAPSEVKLEASTLLHGQAFWHDLRLLSSFTESKSRLAVPDSKPKRREMAVYF